MGPIKWCYSSGHNAILKADFGKSYITKKIRGVMMRKSLCCYRQSQSFTNCTYATMAPNAVKAMLANCSNSHCCLSDSVSPQLALAR